MRIFGKLDGTLNRLDRATFGFLTPFDLTLAEPAEPEAVAQWSNYFTITAGGLVTAAEWRPRAQWQTDRRGR